MSDLRTRITAALREALLSEIGGSIDGVDNIYVGDETVHLVILADAVIRELSPQLTAWARMCVTSGDMTPAAERQLHNILGEYDSDG